MADEIADDPRVLEAALSLVDEWYAEAESTDRTPALAATSRPSGKPTRTREELAAMRSTVRQLQHVIARHWPTERAGKQGRSATSTAGGDKNMTGDARRAQARAVLHAVQTYNRLQTMTCMTLAVVETVQARPFDSERMIDTLRSRLDVLSHIATTNRVTVITAISGTVQELSNTPTLTSVGLQIRAGSGHYVPFKLSLVAEVMWERTRTMLFGGDKQGREQMSSESHDELFGVVARTNITPSGMVTASGPTALRRVYEDDGSVLLVYTSVKTAPPTKQPKRDNAEPVNLFAGLTVKQATWVRLRRVQLSGSSGLERPLVHIELNASLIMEPTFGQAVTDDQLLRAWNAIVEVSTQESRSRQSLENQLLDRSLERQK